MKPQRTRRVVLFIHSLRSGFELRSAAGNNDVEPEGPHGGLRNDVYDGDENPIVEVSEDTDPLSSLGRESIQIDTNGGELIKQFFCFPHGV